MKSTYTNDCAQQRTQYQEPEAWDQCEWTPISFLLQPNDQQTQECENRIMGTRLEPLSLKIPVVGIRSQLVTCIWVKWNLLLGWDTLCSSYRCEKVLSNTSSGCRSRARSKGCCIRLGIDSGARIHLGIGLRIRFVVSLNRLAKPVTYIRWN